MQAQTINLKRTHVATSCGICHFFVRELLDVLSVDYEMGMGIYELSFKINHATRQPRLFHGNTNRNTRANKEETFANTNHSKRFKKQFCAKTLGLCPNPPRTSPAEKLSGYDKTKPNQHAPAGHLQRGYVCQ